MIKHSHFEKLYRRALDTHEGKTGTWSIKNANDCTAWNKGITVNVEV